MSQLNEVSFFFPGEKVPVFYRLFFRNILLYPSKFLMQFLTAFAKHKERHLISKNLFHVHHWC